MCLKRELTERGEGGKHSMSFIRERMISNSSASYNVHLTKSSQISFYLVSFQQTDIKRNYLFSMQRLSQPLKPYPAEQFAVRFGTGIFGITPLKFLHSTTSNRVTSLENFQFFRRLAYQWAGVAWEGIGTFIPSMHSGIRANPGMWQHLSSLHDYNFDWETLMKSL